MNQIEHLEQFIVETLTTKLKLKPGQIGRWIEWFVRLFEPLLMTFIGLLIGLIVILMYMPIFELASSIH